MKIEALCRRVVALAFLWSAGIGNLLAATTYFVAPAPAGIDQAGGGGSNNPWQTLAYAVSMAAAGDTIHLMSGTFVVPASVVIGKPLIIQGAGRDDTPTSARTVVQSGYADTIANAQTYGTPILRFATGSNGSRVEGIEFDGNNRQGGGAIHADAGIDGLVVQDCDFLRFASAAVRLTQVTHAEVARCDFENSGAEFSSGSNGMLTILGAQDSTFHHLDFFSAENGLGSSGYGIKGRYLLRRVEFHDITTNLKTTQAYAGRGDPNFALELWGNSDFDASGKRAARCEEVQIYNGTFRNTLSFAMFPQDPQGYAYAVRFHHNVVDPKGWFGIEAAIEGTIIDHNYFKQADSPIHNFVTGAGSTVNLRIENNLAENVRSRFVCVEGTINGMHVRNNTVYLTPRNSAADRKDFVVFGNSTVSGQNVTLPNNVVVAAPDANGMVNSANFYRGTYVPVNLLAYGAIGSNVIFPTTATYSQNGLYDKIAGDPQFELTGSKPAPYYRPKAVSVARDSGFAWGAGTPGYTFLGLGPERGAIEHGVDYAEIFPNTGADNQPIVTVGWTAIASTSASSLGAPVADVSGFNSVVALSAATGESSTTPLRSSPGATTAVGFAWVAGSGSREALLSTNERYGAGSEPLDASEVTQLSWYAGNGSDATTQRAALKVAGQWYVAETSFSTPAMSAASFSTAAVKHVQDVAATAWRRLTFTPGSTGFQFDATTVPATTLVGLVESAGVFVVNAGPTGGNARLDGFTVTATLKPGLF